VATLAHLREKGDTSEESAIALGIGLAALADVDNRFGIGSTQSQEYNARAVALLRSYADAPNPSVPIRRAYGEVAMSVASYATGKEALALFARAKQALESIGALKLTDLPASADYATALRLEAIELWRLGRIDELKKVSEQGLRLANDILAQRPGHIVALQARSSLNVLGSSPAHEDLRIGDAAESVRRALEDGFLLLRLDPANVDTRGYVANEASALSVDYEELGRPRDARASLQKSLEILTVSEQAAVDHGDAVVARRASISRIDADLGERNAAEAAIREAEHILAKTQAALGDDSYKSANAKCSLANARARLALFEGDFKRAVADAQSELKTSLTWKNRYGDGGAVVSCPSIAALIIGNAELMLGDYDAAKSAVSLAVPVAAAGNDWPSRNFHASLVVLQSIAMSRLRQLAEARALLTPVLDWQRARFARNHDDAQQRLDYASALYALALTDAAHRSELLNQASAIIAALPAEMRSLKSTRMWIDRVQAERGHTTAG